MEKICMKLGLVLAEYANVKPNNAGMQKEATDELCTALFTLSEAEDNV
ncbi:MAG: hypothetical protein NC184_03820 [Roseburia sp.]|nr:hypothetical protein [Roseburia sp.]